MLRFLSGFLGIAIMMPAVSLVRIGDYQVQPAVPVFAALFVICLVSNLGKAASASFLCWLLLYGGSLFLSTLFSMLGQGSVMFLAYQTVSTVLFCWGLYTVFVSRDLIGPFINGFVAFACVSSVLAAVQAIYSDVFGGYLVLTNNQNFTLSTQGGRGVAFAPEASVLASFLFPAFAVALDGMMARDSLLNPWFRGRLALCLIAAGLIATRSSTLLAFPVLILLSEYARRGSLVATIKYFAQSALFLAPFALVFASLFLDRLSASDADLSALVRIAKMQAGLNMFLDHPILGGGLGSGSTAAVLGSYGPPWVKWSIPFDFELAGIDSWLVRTLAEQGLVGGLAVVVPIVLLMWRIKAASRDRHTRTLWLIGIFLLPAFVLAIGYRDMPFMFAIFSASLAMHRLLALRSAARPSVRGNPAGYREALRC